MTDTQNVQGETLHIDVRVLSPVERHPRIFDTLHALAPGDSLLITSDHEPRPLHYQLETGFPGKFSWDYLEQGPDTWRVQITRQDAGCDCCCGSH
ncbi:SirA-like protein (plasmid) [Rhizobium phaseoli]|uniref:DUF2249 domain-containing protein n=1 Tax=Rhizobium phaseoli TaxID=396 RepID=UPI00030EAD36|nr:DUF2249 domain-containing protein [Rhizobium phaseoli]ANL74518.1 SirA-like protein [Rhizobium phaseoli]KKZ85320.1 hypothetical protein RPHASCH2410_PA00975 [Rhizobium phaseoli Ch24-10]RDJ01034.1 aminotransferase [Rhizobium phaseoli]RDJ01516.1 aminotransferase [Rhizobium phaseoli]